MKRRFLQITRAPVSTKRLQKCPAGRLLSARLAFVFLCLVGPFGTGCGYHLRGTGEPLGIHIDSLAIPMMESPSSSLGFEGDFTRVIRQEFASHTRVPLVSTDAASMVLTGKIYEIRTTPQSYRILKENVQGRETTYEQTLSRWLQIRIEAKLVEAKSGKVVWERKFEEKTTYVVSQDPLQTQYNERQALLRIAQLFAERLYAQTMERF